MVGSVPTATPSAATVRKLVPSSHRMVTWATSKKQNDLCLDSADVISFNEYPGWYTESLATVNQTWAAFANWSHTHFPNKPFLIAETGAGAIYEWDSNVTKVRDNYTFSAGALAAGHDLTSSIETWASAMKTCNASAACAGFTFESTDAQPTTAVKGYFKSEANVNSDASWTSWVKGSADVGLKWTQQYQATVVKADIRSALSLDLVSGISVWQFNDINADPSDFDGHQHNQTCKPCEYPAPYDASTPMNCSFISVACFRPGGENHKGVLDFWRRKKRAFFAAKELYTTTGDSSV